MLIFYLAFLVIALLGIAKVLLPELMRPPLSNVSEESNSLDQTNDNGNRVTKLETLLAEKSKNIQILQTELKIAHSQIREFDKIKSLLDEEITRLREQNRIFRSELGLPAAQPKENSII